MKEGEAFPCKYDSLSQVSNAIKRRLVAIYSTKCPEKLSKLPGLLQKYCGAEQELSLLAAVQTKYLECDPQSCGAVSTVEG